MNFSVIFDFYFLCVLLFRWSWRYYFHNKLVLKRGMLILDWCCMCKKCGELWITSSNSYSFGAVDYGVLFIWPLLGYANENHWYVCKHRNIAFWKAVPNCIMLCLWQERNSRSFEGCEWNILEIKTFFLHTLLDWIAAFLSPPFFPHICLIIVFWIDCTSLLVHCWCTRFVFISNKIFVTYKKKKIVLNRLLL